MALLVSGNGRVPLHYRKCEENRYDSRLFARIADDISSVMKHSFPGDRLPSTKGWTHVKILCHIFTCIVALACLQLLEIRLRRAGLTITVRQAIEKMQELHSCLCWTDGRNAPKLPPDTLIPVP